MGEAERYQPQRGCPQAYRALAATLGETMTPVELALAVVCGVLFAIFAYERWKTPRKQLMKDDDSY